MYGNTFKTIMNSENQTEHARHDEYKNKQQAEIQNH